MRYTACLFFILYSSALAWSEGGPLSNPSILFSHAIEAEPGHNDIGFDVLPLANGAIISGSTSVKGKSVDGLLMHVSEKGEVLWRKGFRWNRNGSYLFGFTRWRWFHLCRIQIARR